MQQCDEKHSSYLEEFSTGMVKYLPLANLTGRGEDEFSADACCRMLRSGFVHLLLCRTRYRWSRSARGQQRVSLLGG